MSRTDHIKFKAFDKLINDDFVFIINTVTNLVILLNRIVVEDSYV